MAKQKVITPKAKKSEQDIFIYELISNSVPSPTLKRAPNSQINKVYSLVCEDEIYDPETKGQCKIKYLRGERTIYVDKMSKVSQEKKAERIHIKDGKLFVRKEENTLLDYMNKCNGNVSNPHRDPTRKRIFKLVQVEKDLDKLMEKEDSISIAKSYVMENLKTEEGIMELTSYAEVLGINVDRTLSEIKFDIYQQINQDAKGFMEGMKDPNLKRKLFAIKAKKEGIIKVINNTISWSNGNAIVTVPLGNDVLDYLVEWSFGEGQSTFEHLKEKVLMGEPVA